MTFLETQTLGEGISEGDLSPKKKNPSDGGFSYTHRWDPRFVAGGNVTAVQAV
jgi:hypothetical protein